MTRRDPFAATSRQREPDPPPAVGDDDFDDGPEVPYAELWEQDLEPPTIICMACGGRCLQYVREANREAWYHEDEANNDHQPSIRIFEMGKSISTGHFGLVGIVGD